MVGQQIGANNVPNAKKIYYILFILFIIGDFLDWLLLFLNRFRIVHMYTDSEAVAKKTNYIIWICLLTILESFFKNALLGVIKALEQQKRALQVNFISYVCIVIPCAYFFAFHAQEYGLFLDEAGKDTNNQGLGLWVGYVIGIGLQDLGYLCIIGSTDWQRIADGA